MQIFMLQFQYYTVLLYVILKKVLLFVQSLAKNQLETFLSRAEGKELVAKITKGVSKRAKQQVQRVKNMPPGPAKKRAELKIVFQRYDLDGSGRIDNEEFHSLLLDLLGADVSEAQSHEILNEIDDDQSGSIEFEELFEWLSAARHSIKVRSIIFTNAMSSSCNVPFTQIICFFLDDDPANSSFSA